LRRRGEGRSHQFAFPREGLFLEMGPSPATRHERTSFIALAVIRVTSSEVSSEAPLVTVRLLGFFFLPERFRSESSSFMLGISRSPTTDLRPGLSLAAMSREATHVPSISALKKRAMAPSVCSGRFSCVSSTTVHWLGSFGRPETMSESGGQSLGKEAAVRRAYRGRRGSWRLRWSAGTWGRAGGRRWRACARWRSSWTRPGRR
jgi:hypothetical protein